MEMYKPEHGSLTQLGASFVVSARDGFVFSFRGINYINFNTLSEQVPFPFLPSFPSPFPSFLSTPPFFIKYVPCRLFSALIHCTIPFLFHLDS